MKYLKYYILNIFKKKETSPVNSAGEFPYIIPKEIISIELESNR